MLSRELLIKTKFSYRYHATFSLTHLKCYAFIRKISLNLAPLKLKE